MKLIHIKTETLRMHPLNMRGEAPPDPHLVASIKAIGIINPLTVIPAGEWYEVLAGGRRLVAAREAGLEQVPCSIIDGTDAQLIETTLAENYFRETPNRWQIWRTVRDLNKAGMPPEEIAQRMNLALKPVLRTIRMADTPDDIIALLEERKIDPIQALPLVYLDMSTKAGQAHARTVIKKWLEGWSKTQAALQRIILEDRPRKTDRHIFSVISPETYEQEGGSFIADLLSDQDEWLLDKPELALRLVDERLEDIAKEIQPRFGLAGAHVWHWGASNPKVINSLAFHSEIFDNQIEEDDPENVEEDEEIDEDEIEARRQQSTEEENRQRRNLLSTIFDIKPKRTWKGATAIIRQNYDGSIGVSLYAPVTAAVKGKKPEPEDDGDESDEIGPADTTPEPPTKDPFAVSQTTQQHYNDILKTDLRTAMQHSDNVAVRIVALHLFCSTYGITLNEQHSQHNWKPGVLTIRNTNDVNYLYPDVIDTVPIAPLKMYLQNYVKGDRDAARWSIMEWFMLKAPMPDVLAVIQLAAVHSIVIASTRKPVNNNDRPDYDTARDLLHLIMAETSWAPSADELLPYSKAALLKIATDIGIEGVQLAAFGKLKKDELVTKLVEQMRERPGKWMPPGLDYNRS